MTIVHYKEFLQLAGVTVPEDLGKYEKAATQKEKDELRDMGIGASDIGSSLKARRVKNLAKSRRADGLATPGQMRMLRKLGVSNINKKTFAEAKAIIGDSAHW